MSDTSGDTPSSSQLLQQVRVLDCASESDRVADVAIAAGEIQAIAPHLDPTEFAGSVLRDGRGLVLGPGLVNLYGTCSEPGHEERETLAEFLAAAAAGGFTQVAVLPQTVPAIDRPASVALLQQLSMLAKADLGRATPQLHLWGALTPGCDGEGLVELAELAAAGIVGFSDGRPLASWSLLRRSLEYLQPLAIPIAVVPCDLSVRGAGVMREGPLSLQAGLPGDPALSEAIYLAGLLELVAETETPVHIMRLSTARGVALVAQAKAAGLPVTASTTWLHVLLDSRALLGYNSHLRLDPPLGNPDDRAALIAGVKAGTIDALAVDRAAYAYEEKAVAFADALPGALGFELVLPLLWQHLVATGEWTALELWRSLSWGPSRCLGQTPRHCAAGAPAELTLFNPTQQWTVGAQTLQTSATNTSWWGEALTGRVTATWFGDR